MSEESNGKIHSGCTAVTAFLRLEDADGHQSFLKDISRQFPVDTSQHSMDESTDSPPSPVNTQSSGSMAGIGSQKGSSQNRLKRAFKRLSLHISGHSPSSTPRTMSPTRSSHTSQTTIGDPQYPPEGQQLRRVLYVANAGDARGVLCRNGRALRLTYDHKGTDKQEAKRIMDSGGFVMSGRVNGVLAVTRSLGDSSMKDFVVGSPYTTETELTDEDEVLILACDGVSSALRYYSTMTNIVVNRYGMCSTIRRRSTLYARYKMLKKQRSDLLKRLRSVTPATISL
jgi:protein phosphatase PTC1